ncbi:hypothetical protein [Natroniella sp. ANB-PHB2]|uniref:hypothetical protein n=1 Tax=Natroniella sp. ANB-PHB2 TaxID=3384444 RepID=UPI0038D48CF5
MNNYKNRWLLYFMLIIGVVFSFSPFVLGAETDNEIISEIEELVGKVSYHDEIDDDIGIKLGDNLTEYSDSDNAYNWRMGEEQRMGLAFELEDGIDVSDADKNEAREWLKEEFNIEGTTLSEKEVNFISNGEGELIRVEVEFVIDGDLFGNAVHTITFEEDNFFNFIIEALYTNPVIQSELIRPVESDEDEILNLVSGQVYYLNRDPEGEAPWEINTEIRSGGGIATGLVRVNNLPFDDENIDDGFFTTPSTSESLTISIIAGLTGEFDPSSDIDGFTGYEDYHDSLDPVDSEGAEVGTTGEEFGAMNDMSRAFVGVVADGFGTNLDEHTSARYYFVFDTNDPTVIPLDDEGREEDEFDGSAFRYESRNPEIRIKIDDEEGSGIASDTPMDYYENTNIRYIRKDQLNNDDLEVIKGNDFDETDNIFSRADAGYMQTIDLDDRIEDGVRNDQQEAVFTPWGKSLDEGNYFVFVEVEDMAGNTGRKVFEIEIDQSKPRIHTPRLNDEVIGEGTIVGADELNLYFEVSGAKDVIYGIKYTGEDDNENNDWLIFGEFDLDYSRNEIENNLLETDNFPAEWKDGDEAKAGDYQIFILADEERIKYLNGDGEEEWEEIKEELEQLEDGEIHSIDENWNIEGTVINIDPSPREDEEKRAWEEWIEDSIEVDATIPVYQTGSIKYVPLDQFGRENADYRELEKDGGTRKNTAGDEPSGIDDLYQVRTPDPIFKLQVRNSSNIDTSDVNIYFLQRISRSEEDDEVGVRVRAGIIDHTVDDNSIHTIYFSPSLSLGEGRAGAYDIQLSIRDEFGNQLGGIEEVDRISDSNEFTTEADMEEMNGRIPNLFRIDTVEADIDFSIRSGQTLNTNESSAMEINLDPDSNFEPGNSLRIYINDALIVGPQEGEEEVKIWDREGKIYRAIDDHQYYEGPYADGDIDPNGFDVMTFNDTHRIILFSRRPFATGRNEIRVAVRTEEGEIAERSISFVAENYRDGFGFGRLLIRPTEDND